MKKSGGRWLLQIGVVLIGLVGMGCGFIGLLTLLGSTETARERNTTAEAAPTATVSLGAEQINEAGFVFAPPAEWQVVEQNDSVNGIGFVQLVRPGETAETAEFQFVLFISPIELLAQELPDGEVSLEAIAEYIANASQGTLPEQIEISLGEPRETTIAGEDALALDIDATARNESGKGRIVVAIVNNEQQYFAAIITAPDTAWKDGAIADAVLNTVRFSDSSGP